MSYILGIFSKTGRLDENDFRSVVAELELNGERTVESLKGPNLLLYTDRLWAGHDNIVESQTGPHVIIFSGNVYDFEARARNLQKKGHAIRDVHNAAEFMLYAYLEYGHTFLSELNGTFAFAIHNRESNELILGNSSFGLYPLFVYDVDGLTIFCTEYEPITKYAGFDPSIDREAVGQYFMTVGTLGDRTFFKHIKNLAPATMQTISSQGTRSVQYDGLDVEIDHSSSIEMFAEKLAATFHRGVQLRAQRDLPLHCTLTGGLDTRLILSNLTQEQRSQTQFYTFKNTGLDESKDRDIIISRKLAVKAGLNYHTSPFDKIERMWDDEYFYNSRERNPITTLSGLFGSEIFSGKLITASPQIIQRIISHKMEFLNNSEKNIDTNHPDDNALFELYAPSFAKQFQEITEGFFDSSFRSLIGDPMETLKDHYLGLKAENRELLSGIYNMCRPFCTTMYGGHRGLWLHPYSFHTQLNCVFTDTDVLKLILTIPLNKLAHKDEKIYNALYSNHFPEFTDVPTGSNLGLIEGSCMQPFSEGIEPKEVAIIKGEAEAFDRYLSTPETFERKIYNADHIQKMHFNNEGVHRNNLNNSAQEMAFIDFEGWCRNIEKGNDWKIESVVG